MKDGIAILKQFADDAEKIITICQSRRVRKLELFGSASRGEQAPAASDLDFLVVFNDLPPGEHAKTYFGLLEDLQDLFRRPVDLLMTEAITNPYFLQNIALERIELYEDRN